MKDPVQVLGIIIFSLVLLWLGCWVITWDMTQNREFERECRHRGGTPIQEYSGSQRCVPGQEIKIP